VRRDERVVLMPILARGSHVHPRVGGCFAEVAATLATQTWNGHPNCIPPVLLRLVWGVNDKTSPHARTSLAPLIPWVIGHPRRPHDLTAETAVVTVLTAPSCAERSGGTDLDPLLRRLNRPPRRGHVLDRAIWRRAARHMVRAAAQVRPIGRVVGVDMTPEMLEKSTATAAELGLDHVEFRAGLAESLPVEDAWADSVISNGVINLCADKHAVLSETRRVLKPGGWLQFADIANGLPVPEGALRDIDLWTG
jgi:SAM-dependent methyltransferase